jgi:hypothetical protein
MLDTKKIENVKSLLNDHFEIASAESFQKDLNALLSMAIGSATWETMSQTDRVNIVFRLTKCSEFMSNAHRFSDWS